MKVMLLAAAFAAASISLSSVAQVRVVDSEPASSRNAGESVVGESPVAATAVAVTGVSEASNAQAELYYQLQVLQQEVLELRGLVEQQSYEIKRLKQQRLDDYVDLDTRVAALSGGAPVSAGSSNSSDDEQGSFSSGSTDTVTESGGADERTLYRQAINLVLKEKDYDKASEQLVSYLDMYPQGLYAPNAMYWLGEISLLRSQLQESADWFNQLLQKFPKHNKVADAKYKLGTVYHQLGQDAKAKKLLQEVASSSSSAARLAKTYLSKAYP